jgi:hypothetical protein
MSYDSQNVAPRDRGMTPIRVTLTAGVEQRFGINGDYVHVITAPVTDLQVRFDDGELVPMYEGVGFRRYYREISLYSATGQSVIVLAGFGSVFDGRATANVNVTATVAAGNTLNNGGDVSALAGAATQLLAADASRTYALICNVSTNTLTVRIGSSAVAAATGVPLEPGETLALATTAAIYAYNAGGSAVTINAASVRQV